MTSKGHGPDKSPVQPEPSFDAFMVPPPGARTLMCEQASGNDGHYEIAIFELRSSENVMWTVRKRILMVVDVNDKPYLLPSWTTELHFTQLDLVAMSKQMLGNIIGRVSGESLQVSAARDQVMMDLRTRLNEYLHIINDVRDVDHLHEVLAEIQTGDGENYNAMLTTIRLLAGLVISQMKEREEEE